LAGYKSFKRDLSYKYAAVDTISTGVERRAVRLRQLRLSSSVGVSACRRVFGRGSPYSITERRVPELIPVLSNQPAGDLSHKPEGRLPLVSARPAVTPVTLKRAATNFAVW